MRGTRLLLAPLLAAAVALGASTSAAFGRADVALPTQADVSVVGSGHETYAGKSVDGGGDVNGDGRPDLVVSVPDDAGGSSAYVVFGGGGSAPTQLASLGAGGFRIRAGLGDKVTGVAALGDVNGDSLDDVAVSEQWRNVSTRTQAGAVFVVFGKDSTDTVDLDELMSAGSDAGFVIEGAWNYELASASVAAPGDVNGDDRDDILVGAPGAQYGVSVDAGAAYVVYGRTSDAPLDLADLSGAATAAGYRIDGTPSNSNTGAVVAAPGDVDGDGTPDLLIAAPVVGNNSRNGSGSVYLVWGNPGANVDLAAIPSDRTLGVRIDGAETNARLGDSLGRAGDLNGDGHADLLLGAPATRDGDEHVIGNVFVITSLPDEAVVDLAQFGSAGGPTGLRLIGDLGAGSGVLQNGMGIAIDAIGDVNGDGVDDLAVGEPYANQAPDSEVGRTDVVYGGPRSGSFQLSTLVADPSNGFRALGRGQGGWDLAPAGDLDGDGLADLVIGSPTYTPAPGAWPEDYQRGAAFAVFGARDPEPPPAGGGDTDDPGGDTTQPGVYVDSDPGGGSTASRSPKRHCVVPRLRHASIATAKRRLHARHCRLGRVHLRRSARHVRAGRRRIAAQSPHRGAVRRTRTRVSVWLVARHRQR